MVSAVALQGQLSAARLRDGWVAGYAAPSLRSAGASASTRLPRHPSPAAVARVAGWPWRGGASHRPRVAGCAGGCGPDAPLSAAPR